MSDTTESQPTAGQAVMTAREAAQYLRISREHLWKLRLEFSIPTLRVGTGLRFRKADLDRWMVECEERANQKRG